MKRSELPAKDSNYRYDRFMMLIIKAGLVSKKGRTKNKEIADKTGLDKISISRYVNKRKPLNNLYALYRIAEGFDVPISYFFRESLTDGDPEIMKDLAMTKRILKSGRSFTQSLRSNIRDFDKALTLELEKEDHKTAESPFYQKETAHGTDLNRSETLPGKTEEKKKDQL